MPRLDVERLRELLWPPDADRSSTYVFALVDAARDARLYHALRRSMDDSCCLYGGPLPRAIEEVAPYLVALGRDSESSARLIDLAWVNSAAVFVQSTAILPELRRHFRRFLRVSDESGRKFLFRYYDPRVLRAYLPTCNEEELRYVFGPVDRFLVEAAEADSASAIVFRRSGPALIREVVMQCLGP